MKWFWKDSRPQWERDRERVFIDAINSLKTLVVTDRGGMSIHPEELREKVMASREEYKQFVHPVPKPITVSTAASPVEKADSGQDMNRGGAQGIRDFIQVITWRRLSDHSAVRYVCLQDLNWSQFAVAVADFFSDPHDSGSPDALQSKLAKRITTLSEEPLVWFESVTAAMDAHDASI